MPAPDRLSRRDVLRLQNTIGNRAVQRLLGKEAETGSRALAAPVAPVQRVPVAQRAAPVIIWGLNAAELASIIGVATGVATAIGMAAQPLNNRTGKGPVMKLEFDSDYLIPARGKASLENISRALFFLEMDRLNPGGVEEGQDDHRTTAVGNVRQRVVGVLNRAAEAKSGTFVANGDGGDDRDTPWGAAKVRLNGGYVVPSQFSEEIYRAAGEHGVDVEPEPIDFVKSCMVDYEFDMNSGIVSDDDIYVRGQDLNYIDSGNEIMIEATVAFDWDGDTTYYEWKEDDAMRPGRPIWLPTWRGPSDPND